MLVSARGIMINISRFVCTDQKTIDFAIVVYCYFFDGLEFLVMNKIKIVIKAGVLHTRESPELGRRMFGSFKGTKAKNH